MLTILLTGGTGFIGKVVLERLLVRDDVKYIYLLVRPKRGKSIEERMQDLRTSPCFDNVRSEFDRVIGLEGDMVKANLGLQQKDMELTRSTVTHIINLAAAIDFCLPLAEATRANVTGALELLEVAKTCTKLHRLVHCSTAYVSVPKQNDASIYEHDPLVLPGNVAQIYNSILKGAPETTPETTETELLGKSGHPNTYTYTKAMAEILLKQRCDKVKLVVVRPSIVTASLQYPKPGWIDSRAAFAAFVAMYGAGFLHTVSAKPHVQLDLVPCDYVASRLVCAAFDETNSVVHAVAGRANSISIAEILEVESTFARRPLSRRPFIRIVGLSEDPRVAKSYRKDRAAIRRLRAIARVLHQTRTHKVMSMVLAGLKTLEAVFPHFTHTPYRFESTHPMEEVIPGFDPKVFVELAALGIYHNLLKAEEQPVALPFSLEAHEDSQEVHV